MAKGEWQKVQGNAKAPELSVFIRIYPVKKMKRGICNNDGRR
ncbi:MAG TPA: hypothetical protein PKW97_14250 [Syntrophorhabdus sp.]|jgi:hypothetical protein|nr:MAG: hypothetical protein BWX92_03448 [Deltaproteobacteria bacterium ADurb.Bin135]HOD77199.1 hypothetical protein [Syntrophorhabdus sp.]HQG26472.1 hypothetical protein [Syntrophorhabdus sp.]HQH83645.1 hypothetical protein [Syntrophorhabdus sp.]HQI97312.1 hypothetical protein [Syntrophorhabdus sp.]